MKQKIFSGNFAQIFISDPLLNNAFLSVQNNRIKKNVGEFFLLVTQEMVFSTQNIKFVNLWEEKFAKSWIDSNS